MFFLLLPAAHLWLFRRGMATIARRCYTGLAGSRYGDRGRVVEPPFTSVLPGT
jgi:hypothetical protein